MTGSRWRQLLLLGVVALAPACGKKGAPLPPIVRIPAAVDTIDARRFGNDVYVTLTVPVANIDESTPVDIARIDVYAYTGATPPPRGRFVELGTLVATIPVAQPAPEVVAASPVAPVEVGPPSGATVGTMVSIIDALTPDELEQGRIPAPLPSDVRTPTPPPVAVVATPGPLHRYYLAVPFSTRGRPGPQPTPADLPLVEPPAAPGMVTATVTATGLVLTWEPPDGLLGFLFDRGLAPEPDPGIDVFALPDPQASPTAAAPAGPVRYNLYLQPGTTPVATAAPAPPAAVVFDVPWLRSPGTPVNPAPLDVATFTDGIEFGRERCYVVRAVRGTGPAAVASAPSPVTCVTPLDTFPPAQPAQLIAVAAEGAISLLWEPGGDVDLAGYIVLRGAPGDATLQPLTPMPIAEARFVDSTVVPGMRYTYAVVAVDAALPQPNRSPESLRVEETAR